MLDDNNECTVPWEVLQQPGKVEVSAFCGDLHTANIAVVSVEKTGYKSGETPKDPTPDVYQQFLQAVKDDAATAENAAKTAQEQAQAAAGSAAASAESASDAENARQEAVDCADAAAKSAESAAKSAALAQQDLENKGWMYLDDQDNSGTLYLVTSDSLNDDVTLRDNGVGVLEVVYG